MTTASALRLHAYGTPPALSRDAIDIATPSPGNALIRVATAGLNPIDEKIASGALAAMMPLDLPVILGAEFVGTVLTVGDGADHSLVGTRVMAPTGNLGAYATTIIVPANGLARVPEGLDEADAAALPVAGLTAWQSLFEYGDLREGQRVLIHGASGAVGTLAVQFAAQVGATVTGTASASNLAHVEALGAQGVAYDDPNAIGQLGSFDLILDLAGKGVDALWPHLSERGRLVSTAKPDIAAAAPAGRHASWMQMRPAPDRLERIAHDVAAGRIAVTIAKRWPWSQAVEAIDRRTESRPGKAVVEVAA